MVTYCTRLLGTYERINTNDYSIKSRKSLKEIFDYWNNFGEVSETSIKWQSSVFLVFVSYINFRDFMRYADFLSVW